MTYTDFSVPTTNLKEGILRESFRILKQESKLFHENTWCIPELFRKTDSNNWTTIEKLYNITYQILEFGHSSLVLRSYNNNYNLTEDRIAYESVGGHTNLVGVIIDRIMRLGWSSAVNESVEGFYYNEIMEAVRRHDLPENVIGDIPDNGMRDEKSKSEKEHQFWQDFRKYSTYDEYHHEDRVQMLLDEMEQKSTIIGRMLYLADKIAANIITLCYDSINRSPMITMDDEKASPLDREAMAHCDYNENGYYKASEIWTYGYFVTRETIKYDDIGFYTAIIVIATLIINGEWYKWREKLYTHS